LQEFVLSTRDPKEKPLVKPTFPDQPGTRRRRRRPIMRKSSESLQEPEFVRDCVAYCACLLVRLTREQQEENGDEEEEEEDAEDDAPEEPVQASSDIPAPSFSTPTAPTVPQTSALPSPALPILQPPPASASASPSPAVPSSALASLHLPAASSALTAVPSVVEEEVEEMGSL
jgi:hypothetical protein